MKLFRIFLLCFSAITLAGCCHNMPECDFAIDGEVFQWEGHTLHNGRILAIDGKHFALPEDVNEMHCNAYAADLNSDDITDYLLAVHSTGNGEYFGIIELCFFISVANDYISCCFTTYGGGVKKNRQCLEIVQHRP